MSHLAAQSNRPIAADASEELAERLEAVESQLLQMPQVDTPTTHSLHGGVYTRTVTLKAGTLIIGARIKAPTTLITIGHLIMTTSDGPVELRGYQVLIGRPGRKQAFQAVEDSAITLVMRTSAATVEEAEQEMIDEYARLLSRQDGAINHILQED